VFFVRLAGRLHYITYGGFFVLRLTSFEPRDYRVVFVIQKKPSRRISAAWFI